MQEKPRHPTISAPKWMDRVEAVKRVGREIAPFPNAGSPFPAPTKVKHQVYFVLDLEGRWWDEDRPGNLNPHCRIPKRSGARIDPRNNESVKLTNR